MCASEEGTMNAFNLYFDITSRNSFNPGIIKNKKIKGKKLLKYFRKIEIGSLN